LSSLDSVFYFRFLVFYSKKQLCFYFLSLLYFQSVMTRVFVILFDYFTIGGLLTFLLSLSSFCVENVSKIVSDQVSSYWL